MIQTSVEDTSSGFIPSVTLTVTGEERTRRRSCRWTMTVRVCYTRGQCYWSIGRVKAAGHGLGGDVSSVPCKMRKRWDDPHGRAFKGSRTVVVGVKEGPEMVRAEESYVRAELSRVGVAADMVDTMLGMI